MDFRLAPAGAIESPGNLESVKVKAPVMSPATRSVLLALLGGMMAASFLHDQEIVNLSYGFSPGSLPEGVLMAVTGGLAGCALLLVFRKLRDLARYIRKR